MNPLRKKIMDYAASINICTKCFDRSATMGKRQCERCLKRKRGKANLTLEEKRARQRGYNRTYRLNMGIKPRKVLTPSEKRDGKRVYDKKYKKNKLYDKIRKLALIRHAVEKETEL